MQIVLFAVIMQLLKDVSLSIEYGVQRKETMTTTATGAVSNS